MDKLVERLFTQHPYLTKKDRSKEVKELYESFQKALDPYALFLDFESDPKGVDFFVSSTFTDEVICVRGWTLKYIQTTVVLDSGMGRCFFTYSPRQNLWEYGFPYKGGKRAYQPELFVEIFLELLSPSFEEEDSEQTT